MANNKLIEYLPEFVRDYREIIVITDTEQEEFDLLWEEKDQILNNAFVEDADEYGVERYESILGIIKTPSETLDERKFNILVKVNEQLPYTMNALKEKLAMLCGSDGYFVTLTHTEYALDIKVGLIAKNNLEAVKEMVERVVPCNLICTVTILYNQHSTLAEFTHAELSGYSHYNLRNEVLTHGE